MAYLLITVSVVGHDRKGKNRDLAGQYTAKAPLPLEEIAQAKTYSGAGVASDWEYAHSQTFDDLVQQIAREINEARIAGREWEQYEESD